LLKQKPKEINNPKKLCVVNITFEIENYSSYMAKLFTKSENLPPLLLLLSAPEK